MITNDTSATLIEPQTVAPQTDSATAATTCPHELCHTLEGARSHLTAAGVALDGWSARMTTEGHTYVADGHEAIRLIDAATRTLYLLRSTLIGEIRADEDERFVRVDRMIAEFNARRSSDRPAGSDGRAPRNGGAR